MATKCQDDPFSMEASARNLKEETLTKLRQHKYDNTEALAQITDEELNDLGISWVQRNILMSWVRKLQTLSDPSPTSAKRGGSKLARSNADADQSKRTKQFQNKDEHDGVQDLEDTQTRACIQEIDKDIYTVGQPDSGIKSSEDFQNKEGFFSEDRLFKPASSSINIAVCGRNGTGKSSLINCILNLTARDEGAAKVGLVECTTKLIPYTNPDMPGIVLWDLPGVGMEKYTESRYLTTVEFEKFEAYIIVCSNRFYEEDTWLAAEAEKQGKHFYFVRSKLDMDVRKAMLDYGLDERAATLAIRKDAEGVLSVTGMTSSRLYLVSSVIRFQTKWDFPRLLEDIMEDLAMRTRSLSDFDPRQLTQQWSSVIASNQFIHGAIDDMTSEKQERIAEELVQLRVDDLCDLIDESVLQFKKSEVNIAVCGRSGTGKSSFVNCILNLEAWEAGAAKAGLVECTTDPMPYRHAVLPGVVIWDLPGVGTDKFDHNSYLEKVEFSRYDAFIIVTSNRIFQQDTWLAKEATQQQKPFYFVRTRVDADIESAQRDQKQDEQTSLCIMRDNAKKSLIENGLPAEKVYLVSSIIKHQSNWDFPLLMHELINRTPEKSTTIMVMAMVSCSKEIISKKKVYFAQRIQEIAKEAAAPECSYKVAILGEINMYSDLFGVTDTNLNKWQVEVHKLEPALQTKRHEFDTLRLSLDKEKEKDFLWKLATHSLFAKYDWAINLAKKTKWKFTMIGKKAAEKARQEMAALIKESAGQTLHAALDHFEELALGVLTERSKVAIEKCVSKA